VNRNKDLYIAFLSSCLLSCSSAASAQQFESLPRLQPEAQSETPPPDAVPQRFVEPSNVPDFSSSTPLQAGVQSSSLPVQTHLKLVLETPVDAKTSTPGEIFEAHVRDDLYVGQSLLLPRGSLIRGRVFSIQKPRIISRAAKVSLKLEQIVTPTGEVIPLDAALTFNKGKTNPKGELDPGTNFGSRVSGDVKSVTGVNSKGTARGALVAANVVTLGAPAVATLIGGSAVALFRSGDNVDLKPGDEIEVCLTNDLGLQLN
jgi:hypothetical protein